MKLKEPNFKGEKSIEQCIYERKSVRKFKEKKVELDKLSQLLWVAQAIKNSNRTVPSAGATYPLEIYVAIRDEGFFHYDYKNRELNQILEKDISYDLAVAALNQMFINQAPLNIIICADFSRTTSRYGERGVRYVYIEVGHCAQNIHLEAVSLGLSSVPIGAFEDKGVKNVLELSKEIEPIYIIPIGYPK